MHLLGAHAVILPVGAASFAALRGSEATGGVKFLLAFGEVECCSAIAAGDLLIRHTDKEKEINRTVLLRYRFANQSEGRRTCIVAGRGCLAMDSMGFSFLY